MLECKENDLVEEWRPVKGFEGLYEVSNFGRVRRLAHDILVKRRNGKSYIRRIEALDKKPTKGSDGYWDVSLGNNRKSKFYSIHRLVAETFIPNPENKPTVNHIDCNKDNNRVDNLEWATCSEQMAHASLNKLLSNTNIEVSLKT